MKKAVIVYASTHHGNTLKLVEAISKKHNITLIDASKQTHADLSNYDIIGFASGIDFGKYYDSVQLFLKKNLPHEKPVFFIYTCAKPSNHFTKTVKEEALKKNAILLGEYGCRGYNTYGPWKVIGGINKNHPTMEEINGAIGFFEKLIEESIL